MAGAPLRQPKFPGIYTGQLDRKHNGKPDLFCVVWLQYANGKAGRNTPALIPKACARRVPVSCVSTARAAARRQYACLPHSFTVGHAVERTLGIVRLSACLKLHGNADHQPAAIRPEAGLFPIIHIVYGTFLAAVVLLAAFRRGS